MVIARDIFVMVTTEVPVIVVLPVSGCTVDDVALEGLIGVLRLLMGPSSIEEQYDKNLTLTRGT